MRAFAWIILTVILLSPASLCAGDGHNHGGSGSSSNGNDFFGPKSGPMFNDNPGDFFKKGAVGGPAVLENVEMPGREAYDPPSGNGVVRPGGYESYDPPTGNGVVRPGGFQSYDPPTANGVVRPGGFKPYDPKVSNGVVRQ